MEKWLISVDDHLIEPPHVWLGRLQAHHQDSAPRWIDDEHGGAWLFEGRRIPMDAMGTAGAIWPKEARPPMFHPLRWDQVHPACHDPKARVEAMNVHHEIAALCFPNMPGFAGSLFQRAHDKDLALACIRAYNDWFFDEWVDAFPGRFIGLGLVPLWDARLAAEEAERVIARGARSISFSQAPQALGFPPVHDKSWDPLFSVMNDAHLPLSTHLGTGMTPAEESQAEDFTTRMREAMKNNDLGSVAERMGITGPDASPRRQNMLPGASTSLIGARMGQATLNEWLESGNFVKYPHLRLALSENGVGWMPSALSLADWSETMLRLESPCEEPMPSQLFRDHVVGCFIHEPITPELVAVVGADNIMIETDFPHTATNWPYSMERALACMERLPEETQDRILRTNAENLFKFTPAEPPALVG
ncbi:MAG TPA: amidohydrolase family protein [Acidimicrobiales bacterium]|nr:amidohydrolase family protein [Acidimicrobiales bacterium]